MFESIIDRQNNDLENSLKVGELLENSLHHDRNLAEEKSLNQSLDIKNANLDSSSHQNNPAHPTPNPKNPLDSSIASNRSSKKSRILQFK